MRVELYLDVESSKKEINKARKSKVKKPKIRSVAATVNAFFLVSPVQFFMCSIRSKSPPIVDGKKIEP